MKTLPSGSALALSRNCGACLIMLTGSAALAQGLNPQDSAPLLLEPIVITSNNREKRISDVQASIQVITREDIERTPGRSAIDALKNAVGVDARNSGANSNVNIRGQLPGAGSAVLILVDGLPRTGKFGVDNLNLTAVENVERIEVIRGPMSALYGADASAGVINIITRKPDANSPAQTIVRATVGTSASSDGNGRETFNLGVTTSFSTSHGAHQLTFGSRLANPFSFEGSEVEELSGIRHFNLDYAGRWQLSEGQELRLQLEAVRQDDRRDTQTTFPFVVPFEAVEEEDRYFAALHYAADAGPGKLLLDLSHGYTNGSANRSRSVERTTFNESLFQARYQLNTIESSWGSHDLQFGAGYQHSDIDVDIYDDEGTRRNLFGYIQDEWAINDKVAVVAGLRFDDFSDFGTEITPRLTVGSRGDGLTWRLGYGEAYRAPSLIEQYSSFTRGRFLIVGDPDIGPETTEAFEAAIGWRGNRGGIEAIYHHSDIDGLIESARTGRTIGGLTEIQYQNIAQAEIQGLEVTGDLQLRDNLKLNGSYAYLDAKNGETGERLQRRARHELKLAATWERGPFAASLAARGSFDYLSTDSSQPRGSAPYNSDFVTADASFAYELNNGTKLTLGIENITDRQAPDNFYANRSTPDPAGRFIYFTTELRF